MLLLYGIKNCNTVKSAQEWLKKNSIDFEFHDYKTKGITEVKLLEWSKQVGWESLVNKRGTTWRQLPSVVQETISDQKSAIQIMLEKTSLIKRPLIEQNGRVVILGFDEEDYQQQFERN